MSAEFIHIVLTLRFTIIGVAHVTSKQRIHSHEIVSGGDIATHIKGYVPAVAEHHLLYAMGMKATKEIYGPICQHIDYNQAAISVANQGYRYLIAQDVKMRHICSTAPPMVIDQHRIIDALLLKNRFFAYCLDNHRDIGCLAPIGQGFYITTLRDLLELSPYNKSLSDQVDAMIVKYGFNHIFAPIVPSVDILPIPDLCELIGAYAASLTRAQVIERLLVL